jgi:ABC-type transporter Mla MlaB component
MLRITDVLHIGADGRTVWTLRLEGTLKDEWVRELRRSWRRIREAAAGAPIRVELADVGFVDSAGKVLLAEMHRDGVEIVAKHGLAALICNDIVDRSTRDRSGH